MPLQLDSYRPNSYALPVPEKTQRWKLYLLFALILLISVFFLRDTYWLPTLSEKEFIALYVEVARLQARLADQPEEADAQTQGFLKQAGVTKEQIERFMAKVNRTPERWVIIWEKITKELEKDSTLLKNR